MKIQDNWINAAIKALTESNIVDAEGRFDGEFKGYISAFGAACIQSGLLPAVMFYENKSDSNAERSLLIKAIVIILRAVRPDEYAGLTNTKFFDYLINNSDKMRLIQADVNKAAAALKLSLRIYKKKEKKDENNR